MKPWPGNRVDQEASGTWPEGLVSRRYNSQGKSHLIAGVALQIAWPLLDASLLQPLDVRMFPMPAGSVRVAAGQAADPGVATIFMVGRRLRLPALPAVVFVAVTPQE